MSGWAAPYFSPGGARVIHSVSYSQAYGCERLRNSLVHQREVWGTVRTQACASESGLRDCAHARDVVLARTSLTYVARALFVYG